MVNISIIVEGGVFETNVSAATVDNSNALRESMYRIFENALGREDISIEVHMAGPNRNAARAFSSAEVNTFLYTDLDTDSDHKAEWFIKMESGQNPITFSDEKKSNIFFMIQEMEAWILKQPEAIEKWALDNNFTHFPNAGAVSEHKLIKGVNIEDISKPSDKLADIIKQTFQSDRKRKNGKYKGVIYGKLKSAPGLLDSLDVAKLIAEDSELLSFCGKIKELLR